MSPKYFGGFSDVWEGTYKGKAVAAKVLRLYSISDVGEIRKVGNTQPSVLAAKLIILYTAVLSGGRNVERTPSSKCTAIGGCDDGGKTFCDGLRVDA